ncbi:hypothetical protein D3C86_1941960 [compost metagenome]
MAWALALSMASLILPWTASRICWSASARWSGDMAARRSSVRPMFFMACSFHSFSFCSQASFLASLAKATRPLSRTLSRSVAASRGEVPNADAAVTGLHVE